MKATGTFHGSMVGDIDFIKKVRQMMFFYVFGPIETDSQGTFE